MYPIISSYSTATERLKYCIATLKGETYLSPIGQLMEDMRRELKIFHYNGYAWHEKILEYHINDFKHKCRGYDPDTELRKILEEQSNAESVDTTRSTSEGVDSY